MTESSTRTSGQSAGDRSAGDSGTEGRLPYVPALDSLRAIAVIGVLAYHHDPAAVRGGWLGVSMFFTLSGFLIAGLLIDEHRRTGRVDLSAFWSRRIRRLLPASLVAVGLAAGVVALDPAQLSADVFPDLRAAVLNLANWHFVLEDAPYGGAETTPSPVKHYWSLAIEEQFYLVFPVVAALALRRRLLPAVVVAVIAGSLLLQIRLAGDVDRAYFGTDTRAGELAAGIGLAIALPTLRRLLRGRHALADVWGLVGLAATLVLFVRTPLTSDVVGAGTLTAVSAVWVGLLVASVCGRVFPALLARGPLPPIGRISYGIYLFHWPVYLAATTERTSLDGPSLLAFRVAATLLLAAASNALLELPIRRRSLPLRPVATTALASIAAIVVLTTAFPGDGGRQVAASFEPPPTVRATAVPAPAGPDDPSPDSGPQARVPRLLVIGDSTANINGPALQRAAAADGVAEVSVLHQPGCNVRPFDAVLIREGYVYESPCGDLIGDALDHAEAVDPDAIVVFLGNMALFDARYDGSGEYRSILDDDVATAYRAALADAATRLSSAGVPVLWADVPPAAYDPDVIAALNGWTAPGRGEATSNDPARAALLDRIDRSTIEPMPTVTRWGYTAAITGPDGEISESVRPDGMHLDEDAAERLSSTHFLPALREAYGHVHREMAGPLADRSPTTWTPS